MKDKHDTAQTALGNAENLLQSLLTGLSGQQGGAGGGGGYLAQLADARARQERAVAEETQARKRVEMGGKELREKQARAKELEREAGEGKKTLEKVAREVEEMKTRMDKTGWNADKEREVEAAIGNARAEARKHRDVCISCLFAMHTDTTIEPGQCSPAYRWAIVRLYAPASQFR